MAYALPDLDPLAVQVLRVVKDKGVVRGYEVLRVTGSPASKPKKILDAVGALVRNDLVFVTGDWSSTDQLGRAYLTFRPSAATVADVTLRSAL